MQRHWTLPLLGFTLFTLGLTACNKLNLFERSVSIPKHEWKSNFEPSFTCKIKDTTSLFDIALVLRHRDRYHYNNIWLQITIIDPSGQQFRFNTEKILGTNEKGWLGVGMDDIYEHRLSLQSDIVKNGVSLRKKGTYQIRVKQIMREDPLQEVMNVGVRIEKMTQGN